MAHATTCKQNNKKQTTEIQPLRNTLTMTRRTKMGLRLQIKCKRSRLLHDRTGPMQHEPQEAKEELLKVNLEMVRSVIQSHPHYLATFFSLSVAAQAACCELGTQGHSSRTWGQVSLD
jgi:hypothetical protein